MIFLLPHGNYLFPNPITVEGGRNLSTPTWFTANHFFFVISNTNQNFPLFKRIYFTFYIHAIQSL